MVYSHTMTIEMRKLAIKHLAGFAAAKGIPDDHLKHMEMVGFTEEELRVGATQLLEDPEVRSLMIEAYKKLPGVHNYVNASPDEIANHIITQVNLMRSGFINGMYGNMDGLEE